MTETAVACAICRQPAEGIPYGPRDAEVCVSCWLETGTYALVRLRAQGPKVGAVVEFEDAVDAIVTVFSGRVLEVDLEKRCAKVQEPSRNGHQPEPEWIDWDWLL